MKELLMEKWWTHFDKNLYERYLEAKLLKEEEEQDKKNKAILLEVV
jgi:hypothetical protein